MPRDSIRNTAQVAIGVCLVCSLLVSTAAVTLRGRQERNKRFERIRNILKVARLLRPGGDIGEIYRRSVTPVLVELKTGNVTSENSLPGLSVEDFDINAVAMDPTYGRALSAEENTVGLVRVPKYMVVYMVKEGGRLRRLILPVYGKGLWSTVYGFLALEGDLRTVAGITFYEHGETPGLGGEIENPAWQGLWQGKEAYDEKGNVVIEVVKRAVDQKHHIDGISGATLTSRGVNNLVRYWLGEKGYGHFIRRLREGKL